MWRRHPDNNTAEAWRDMSQCVREATRIAEGTGVTLAFEPEVNNVVDSAQKARRLLDEIGSPHLKVTFDAANFFHSGELPRMKEILDAAVALLGQRHRPDPRQRFGSRRRRRPSAGRPRQTRLPRVHLTPSWMRFQRTALAPRTERSAGARVRGVSAGEDGAGRPQSFCAIRSVKRQVKAAWLLRPRPLPPFLRRQVEDRFDHLNFAVDKGASGCDIIR